MMGWLHRLLHHGQSASIPSDLFDDDNCEEALVEQMLDDFSAAVGSYFATTRIPASIITGSSLGALFALPKFSTMSEHPRTPIELFLIKLYRLFSWASFILSLNASIICTMASTKVLHQQFDPLAETFYELLKREFEFEFVSVKWSRIMSLLLFIAIVTVRMTLEFELLTDPTRKDTAKFVTCSAVALTCHLLSYINESLYHWKNVWDMTCDLVILVVSMAWHKPTILRTISLLGFAFATFFAVQSALTTRPAPEPEPLEKEDPVSSSANPTTKGQQPGKKASPMKAANEIKTKFSA